MSTGIGERVREARISAGMTLEEAEDKLKIRTPYLIAIEGEDWEALPGRAYARGFLHSYAELLGLDADALVVEYEMSREPSGIENEAAPQIAIAERHPVEPRVEAGRGRRAVRWVVAAAVVSVLGIALLLGLMAGSDGHGGEQSSGAAPTPSAGAEKPGRPVKPSMPRATVELAATGEVWVCLVDRAERPVIEGVTLAAGEKRGPFHARGFDLALGNGQVSRPAESRIGCMRLNPGSCVARLSRKLSRGPSRRAISGPWGDPDYRAGARTRAGRGLHHSPCAKPGARARSSREHQRN